MSQSIKLNDNTFIDATGVYDRTLCKTQREINDFIIQLPFIRWRELPSQSSDTETYFREWVDYMISNGHLNQYHTCLAAVNPNSHGWCIGYGLSDGSYCGFTAQLYGQSSFYMFGKSNGTWYFATK